MEGFFICIFNQLKQILKIIILTAVLASCGDQEEKEIVIPEYVLDKEKFSDLIVDFTLAESASGINVLGAPPQRIDTVYAFNPLLDNNVKRVTFDTTLYFYSHNPKLFKEVYILALEKLSKMQSARK